MPFVVVVVVVTCICTVCRRARESDALEWPLMREEFVVIVSGMKLLLNFSWSF